MISQTNITKDDKNVILSRRIKYKYVKVDFGLDVKAIDLISYFALPDEHFMKLVRR